MGVVCARTFTVLSALPSASSSSVNSDMPNPTLAPYAVTKAGIANFSASLAQYAGESEVYVRFGLQSDSSVSSVRSMSSISSSLTPFRATAALAGVSQSSLGTQRSCTRARRKLFATMAPSL